MHFIWFFGGALNKWTSGQTMDGALVMSLGSESSTKFHDYFKSLTPDNYPENPWIKGQWENIYDCKWNDSYGNDSCYRYSNKPPENWIKPNLGKFSDSAAVLARVYTVLYQKFALRYSQTRVC